MAIYEILASSTSEIQGITCFIIQLFIAEAMFFFHLKKRKRFWLRLLVGELPVCFWELPFQL